MTSADAVVIRRPGIRAMSGRGVNRSGSTPTGTRRIRAGSTPMSPWMSRDRVLAHHDDAGHLTGDAGLHLHEGVPAAYADPLPPGRCVLHLQAAVDGDGMVERDDRGQQPLDGQQAVAEALVVVDEIELVGPPLERLPGSNAEGQRLAERAGRELEDLDDVAQVADLPVGGEAAGVVVVEDVEARELGQPDPLVEHRVGLPAEHLDRVSEIDERLGEVTGVDALAADVGFAPVREVGDAERIVRPRPIVRPRVHGRRAYRRVTHRPPSRRRGRPGRLRGGRRAAGPDRPVRAGRDRQRGGAVADVAACVGGPDGDRPRPGSDERPEGGGPGAGLGLGEHGRSLRPRTGPGHDHLGHG